MHVATNLSEIGFHLSPALLRSEIRFLVPHTQPPFPCELVPVHLYCLQRVRINEMEIHQVALRPSPPSLLRPLSETNVSPSPLLVFLTLLLDYSTSQNCITLVKHDNLSRSRGELRLFEFDSRPLPLPLPPVEGNFFQRYSTPLCGGGKERGENLTFLVWLLIANFRRTSKREFR